VNRIQKVLEDANVKLSSVASNVVGVSGRSMLEAIIEGESDPNRLAQLARRKLRGKIPQLAVALEGRITDHHRFMLETLLGQVTYLDGVVDASPAGSKK
jgi:transposase